MSHLNIEGLCPRCEEILDRFPGFDPELRAWFENLRVGTPDAHVSCGGRGRADQEQAFRVGASRARYGQSAHNFNLALDIFRLTLSGGAGKAEWPREWFQTLLGSDPQIGTDFEWYGAPGASFYELPHVQKADWRDLVSSGMYTLVEP